MKEKIETKITLDQMADWYQKAIAYSIGDETSLVYLNHKRKLNYLREKQ